MGKRKVALTNLKEIRLKGGFSQNEFGDILGFKRNKNGQSYYRKYESGQLALTAEHAYTITRTFNISLAELLQYV